MSLGARPKRVTLSEAIEDFGSFPLLLIGLGGFSILAVFEQGVLGRPLELVQILQWPLDGYHRIMRLIGNVMEPLIQPAITWLNSQLNWDLRLDTVWRPLFALGMVVGLSWSRTGFQEGTAVRGTLEGGAITFGALVGSLLAGSIPADGGWWVQGLRTAAPLAGLFVVVNTAVPRLAMFRPTSALADRPIEKIITGSMILIAGSFLLGGIAFVIAASLSFVPGFSFTAGLVTLAGFIALFGLLFFVAGTSDADPVNARFGLTILGGFLAAGLILTANWGLKAVGAD